uniref:Uncharacterized protein n=1 Tax=mine drainage metagenome TaxID=410659 RepID=E6QIA0_9ZZZZ
MIERDGGMMAPRTSKPASRQGISKSPTGIVGLEQITGGGLPQGRPTLGWGSSAIREVEETIRAICKVEGDDGILFDGESVEGTRIKEEDEYKGVRVKFHAVLAGTRTSPRQRY